MERNIHYYTKHFATLRVDRKNGPAPHKPVLLLAIISLIKQGHIRRNAVKLDAELVAAFLKLWNQLVTTDHRSDIGLPFFHLRSQNRNNKKRESENAFWHYQPNPGYEAIVNSSFKIRNNRAIREMIDYAYFDNELFDFLLQPETRLKLIQTLASTWFPNKISEIENLLEINAWEELIDEFTDKGGEVYDKDAENEEEKIVRDGKFRKGVVRIYEHRCAFCRLKILNSLGQNTVDGAHIKPFSQFRDDRLVNGLSLCKNHHWAFDKGWFSLRDGYQIVVADNLLEESPNARPLREFHGEQIWLPSEQKFHPMMEAIEWHYTNVFQKTG